MISSNLLQCNVQSIIGRHVVTFLEQVELAHQQREGRLHSNTTGRTIKNCIPRYNTSITSQNMHQLKVRHTKHSRTFNDTRRGIGAFSYFNNISTYEGNNDKGKLKLEQLSDLISLQLITFSILTMTSKQQQPASRFINTSRQFGGNKTLRTFNFVICELSGMQCDQI